MPNTRVTKISPISGIIIGFLIFEFSDILSVFEKYSTITKILGLTIILYFTLKVKINKLKSPVKNLLHLFFFIELIMILIGLFNLIYHYDPFDGSLRNLLRHLLLYQHSPLTLLIPLAAFISVEKYDFLWLKKIGIIVCIIQLLLVLFNLDKLFGSNYLPGYLAIETNNESVSIRQFSNAVFSGAGLIFFLSMNNKYFEKKTNILYFISLFFAFICISAGGGRGSSILYFGYLITLIFLFSSKSKFSFFKKLIMLLLLICVFIYLYKHTSVFSYLFSRLFEDDSYSQLRESSRKYFTDALINDFNAHPLAWIFGRGIYGAYLLPDGTYRTAMEWGFLYLILKGGVIYLSLYVGILLYSAKKGFFNSNNIMCKAMSVLCFFQVLELIPFGVPDISVKFFLVWWFVGILTKPKIRNMSDDDIKYYLFE